ncbi:riboflavin kinase [Neosynechococcus sphagnicola sy1]|uniref:Riboflavin biosynthesis protein n=1 Tax=Neosynechococcus sphagnicola sy1 TaxID=1497020 RepID=A0A098TL59_9CYAN|nr:bifunctional riboflavin kinase/FAD synthetase [Neosynechococcus sphagnicola]KGF72572.1 riboflavin kinase [Neosynechococcus sphagnicola sy1]
MWVTSSLTTALTPTTVALGNFDGVHRGHRRVIQPIVVDSLSPAASGGKRLPGDSSPGAYSGGDTSTSLSGTEGCVGLIAPAAVSAHPYPTVVTFHPHPQEFFSGESRLLLTPFDQKVLQLQALGVEQLVQLPFDRELADLSPSAFVETILVNQLRATQISVGENFQFGCQRSGTSRDLQMIAGRYGIEVMIVPIQTCEHAAISSSSIRQLLQEGAIAAANYLLGYDYCLVGTVVPGAQLGRTLGFPTANLQIPGIKFLPRQGVYAVRVTSSTLKPDLGTLSGVMNLGFRPTVDGHQQVIEVHLLDWSGDLYGQTLVVSLEQFLRPEQKFSTLDDLQAQIQLDCRAARAILMPPR